jgi:FAD/FMN-containing dehydrogenase
MSELRIATMNGSNTLLKETAIEAFQASLRSELLREGHTAYEEARKIHNGMIDRRPALIVRCTGVADVMSAIHFARDNDLLVSVRGGGHGGPGFAVCDGGLMIDLSPMKSIRVDPMQRTARAEGGVTWGEFDHETQAFGLATTGGVARPTGIAGLTLAGGHGFLMRKHGLACDNLLSVDIVTADGQMRTASLTEYADLFWGVRGGGGNFGVVTSFEYQLHPVGLMLGGLLIYPMNQASQVLRYYHEFTSTAPDELGSLAVLGTLPDGTPAVVILLGYNGPMDQGEQVLRPLRAFGSPLEDRVGPLPYTALQSIVENFNPPGLRNYWKTSYLTDLSDEAIDTMVGRYATVPAPYTHVILYTLGGAMSRIDKDETAVAYRDARHAFLVVGMWSDCAEDEKNIRWVRDLWSAMQPFSSGGFYINYEADTGLERVEAAYGPEKYERLIAVKNKYDPVNLFRLNQNIRPTV